MRFIGIVENMYRYGENGLEVWWVEPQLASDQRFSAGHTPSVPYDSTATYP